MQHNNHRCDGKTYSTTRLTALNRPRTASPLSSWLWWKHTKCGQFSCQRLWNSEIWWSLCLQNYNQEWDWKTDDKRWFRALNWCGTQFEILLTDCSGRGCKVLNTCDPWSQIPKIGIVCTTGSSWTTRRTAREDLAHWIGLGWDPQCLADSNGRGCKVVSTYVAGSQIEDICACIATTSDEIAEWMARRDSAHRICPVSDFKCPADCIWSTSKVVNLLVAGSQIPKIGDICSCRTATIDQIARRMARWDLMH